MKNLLKIFPLIIILTFTSFSQTATILDGSLEFDSSKHHHVNHGMFWKPGVEQGIFFWEAWVKPYSNAEYIISDGYGGTHALLFGFSGGVNQLALSGNMWSNATNTSVSFGTDETVPANQWCHIAVGWDGSKIVTYINGVPSGIVPYSGQRSNLVGGGTGVLFVGGSDHSNFNGKIARIRGFEGALPMDNLLNSFKPEKYFRSSYLKSNGDIVSASFLVDYGTPSKTYADLSVGFNGANHVGVLSAGNDIGFFGFIDNYTNNLPTWTSECITPPTYARVSAAIPSGAIVYDSFSRGDVNPAFNFGSGLGSLEKGASPIRTENIWRGTYLNQWGIINGRGYNAGGSLNPVYVETGISNMDVRATRLSGGYSSGDISVVYRYQNDNNYGFAQTVGNVIYLVEVINGSYALSMSAATPSNWNTLQVVANGSSVKVLCSGTQVISATTTNLLSATKAGLRGTSGTGERFDNFTVSVPQ